MSLGGEERAQLWGMRLGKSLGTDDGYTLGLSPGTELRAMRGVIDGARLGESLSTEDGNAAPLPLGGRTEISQ